MYLDLQWDDRLARGISEKDILQVARRSMSRAVKAMQAEAVRRIRARKALKAAAIRKAMHTFSRQRGLEWRINVSGKPIPVMAFSVRQTRRGVTVKINRSSGSLLRHAFIATMPKTGHRGVFTRDPGSNRRGAPPNRPGLPITEAVSSAVADMFQDTGFREALYARGQEVFERDFLRLIQRKARK